MNTETRREVILKTVGDVAYVAIMVGTIVLEIKVMKKVDVKNLSKLESFILDGAMTNVIANNIYRSWKTSKRIVKRIKNYRDRNMDERRSEMGEFMKKSYGDYTEQLDEVMNAINWNEVLSTLNQVETDYEVKEA